MEWVRENGTWRFDPSIEPPTRQLPPEDSSHLGWAAAGQVEIASLKDGDRLSQDPDNGQYTLNGGPLGVDEVIPLDCPRDVTIRFEVEDAGLRLVLPDAEGLVWLAKKTKCTRIRVALDGSIVEFSPEDNAQWSAPAELQADRLPGKLSVGRSKEAFNVSWLWVARSPGLFTIDGAGNVVDAQASLDRSKNAGIILDSSIPMGLTINKGWSVRSLRRQGTNGYLGTLHAPTGEVTLLQLEKAAKSAPLAFQGTGYKATVDTSGWPYYQKRYYAKLGTQKRVEPSVGDDSRVSGYGPKQPFHIGTGDKPPGLTVKLLPGPMVASYSNRCLQKGLLPAPQGEKDFILFSREEDRQEIVVGILNFACTVPAGKWEPAQQLRLGDHIVSWRGFVDGAKIISITVDGAGRHVLTFNSGGLELKRELWFAAPFLGIAMTKNATWWGDAKYPEASNVSYRKKDDKWLIKGRWISLDLTAGTGRVRDAAVLTGPCTLAFIGTADPNDVSGPILQVGPGYKPPKLIGWIADANGKVGLDGAKLVFANELESNARLGPETNVDDFHGAENIKAALRSARQSPNDPEGIIQGVHWRRHPDGVIEAWEATEMGVYVLTET